MKLYFFLQNERCDDALAIAGCGGPVLYDYLTNTTIIDNDDHDAVGYDCEECRVFDATTVFPFFYSALAGSIHTEDIRVDHIRTREGRSIRIHDCLLETSIHKLAPYFLHSASLKQTLSSTVFVFSDNNNNNNTYTAAPPSTNSPPCMSEFLFLTWNPAVPG